MTTKRELRSAVVPLFAASVLLQSVLSLVPHSHAQQARAGPCELVGLRSHFIESPNIVAVVARVPAVRCLACIVTPLTFAPPVTEPATACDEASSAAEPLSVASVSLPRPWRHPLRGPPIRAA